MKSIMIDNETLGVTADAVILSIGAVKFDLDTGKVDDAGFYASISIDSNLEYGRRISESTLKWWLKQPAAAQDVFFENKTSLGEALAELSTWVGNGEFDIWSNGADFDIPMLTHAYTQVGLPTPWKFYNTKCFRTWKNLPGAKSVKLGDSTGVKHHALADALNQAEAAIAINKALFGKKGK